MKFPRLYKSKKTANPNGTNHTVVQSLAHRVARDPYIDWFIIFGVVLVVAIVLAAQGVFTYLNMGNLLASPSAPEKSTAGIDVKGLEEVLGEFKDRAAERVPLLHAYRGPGDPSI